MWTEVSCCMYVLFMIWIGCCKINALYSLQNSYLKLSTKVHKRYFRPRISSLKTYVLQLGLTSANLNLKHYSFTGWSFQMNSSVLLYQHHTTQHCTCRLYGERLHSHLQCTIWRYLEANHWWLCTGAGEQWSTLPTGNTVTQCIRSCTRYHW
jgi:hypothetical protein